MVRPSLYSQHFAFGRGVRKHGGEVKLNAHVDQVLMEKGRATGVRLKSGQVIKTRKVRLSLIACHDLLTPDIPCAAQQQRVTVQGCRLAGKPLRFEVSQLASRKPLIRLAPA